MEIIEAIEKLKESHALVCLENRALIKMEKDKVYIWHSQWHSKLSRNDFISLFQKNTFEVYENDHGITFLLNIAHSFFLATSYS